MNLNKELETAKTLARMAASICQSVQAEMVNHAEGGHGPVTIADYASQALILSGWRRTSPTTRCWPRARRSSCCC